MMKTLPVRIRSYRDVDWEAVQAVHDRARCVELAAILPADQVAPMAEVAEEDRFHEAESFVAVLPGRGQIVGFVSIDRAELTWLYVDPEHQGRGIGRTLVGHVMPRLGTEAWLICVEENPRARRLYELFGFELAARFPGEVQGRPCTVLRLCLPSSSHRDRPPRPGPEALRLAGFTADRQGNAVRRPDGVWIWA